MKKLINKLPLLLAFLSVTFFSCQQEEDSLSQLQGTVHFGGISLEFEPMGSPGSRVMGNSPWIHVFPNSAELVFKNKLNGIEYVLEYNPNDFSVPYSITLPFGAYEYHSTVEGGVFSEFLPFEAKGEFILDSQSLEISLKAETGYGLLSVKDLYVEKVSVSDGSNGSDLVLHQECNSWFIYVKGGTATTLMIKESFQGSTIVRELNILANKHYNFVLKLNEGSAVIKDLILDPFDLEEEDILIGGSSKFFEENGTIKCPEATPGEKGMVNDKIYEAVDRALLITRRDEGADLSCVCTSLVTDMSGMFAGTNLNPNFFNKNIGSWDVSNVTNMEKMFQFSAFNQNIGKWDVSKVKSMELMFYAAYDFNQPLGEWNVSNVENMAGMFYSTEFNHSLENWDVGNVKDMNTMFSEALFFNQPLGNWNVSNVVNMELMFHHANKFNQPLETWDVSKVKNMRYLFSDTPFNHNINDWDVSNVTNMNAMFGEAIDFNQNISDWDVSNVTEMMYMFRSAESFNQPIGDWNVENVTNMNSMFFGAIKFNQPIGNWNVSNVTNMNFMFNNATKFNQNLNGWCVQNIPSEPMNFSAGSALFDANKPIWGTCPD